MAGLGTVLVTGGAGFIGTTVSQLLADRASRWVAVDNLHPQVHAERVRPQTLASSAELIVADVTERATWDSLLANVRPDTVLHLAAETGTGQSLHEATRHANVNVVGTTEMLDAFSRVDHVPAHFVFSGSRAVYGEGEWTRANGAVFRPGQRSHAQLQARQWDFPGARPLPSSASRTWPAPTSIYGATKLAQEHILAAWTAARESKLTVLRFQNVYGPGQSLTNPYTGIVSLFSQMARRGESIPVYEDGLITRDFVYIDDVARAVESVMVSRPDGDVSCFDVGSGVGTTILHLAEILADYHGAPRPHVNGAFRDGDVRHASCDINESLERLEWSPEWSVERGVGALQAWIEQSL